MNRPSKVKTVLVVEDSEMDVVLLKRTLAKAGVRERINVVRDGEEAIDYLSGEEIYSDRAKYPLPDLVLLDLKLPKMNGFDVLDWLRKQPGFECLAVVVFTSSDEPQDVNRAYRLHANSYVQKPFGKDEWEETTALLHRYWTEINVCS